MIQKSYLFFIYLKNNFHKQFGLTMILDIILNM